MTRQEYEKQMYQQQQQQGLRMSGVDALTLPRSDMPLASTPTFACPEYTTRDVLASVALLEASHQSLPRERNPFSYDTLFSVERPNVSPVSLPSSFPREPIVVGRSVPPSPLALAPPFPPLPTDTLWYITTYHPGTLQHCAAAMEWRRRGWF